MNFEFKDCIEKRKITEYSRGAQIAPKEMDEAESDLATAKTSFNGKNYKWATVQCYYAMFHAAMAMLYMKKYRESSHHCLILAIKELYVSKKLFDVTLLEAFQAAKRLREAADYQNEWSKESCGEIMENAAKFIENAAKIVKGG